MTTIPEGLGTAASGQPWEIVEGGWGILDETATVSGAGATRLVTAPQEVNNGLVEATLSVAAEGAGVAFRYQDPGNYWSVTATPAEAVWTVTQVVNGVATTAAEFPAPAFDGVTVTVTQNGSTIRFLIDGVGVLPIARPCAHRRASFRARGRRSIGFRSALGPLSDHGDGCGPQCQRLSRCPPTRQAGRLSFTPTGLRLVL